MIDQAIGIAMRGRNDLEARNLLREYVHHLILRELFEKDVLRWVVFHGGTALRIIHDLHRFSEDLDFHLERAGQDINTQGKMKRVRSSLESAGYKISFKENYDKTVDSVFVRFHELLQEAGISSHKTENLSVKVEIDTHPPPAFTTETTSINRYFPFVIKHHDRASFLAGKLHAILQRPYPKGRDIYDLVFYLSRWPGLEPNLEYLNHALEQTGYDDPNLTLKDWKRRVMLRLERSDFTRLQKDVQPFLESEADLALMSRNNLLSLLT